MSEIEIRVTGVFCAPRRLRNNSKQHLQTNPEEGEIKELEPRTVFLISATKFLHKLLVIVK